MRLHANTCVESAWMHLGLLFPLDLQVESHITLGRLLDLGVMLELQCEFSVGLFMQCLCVPLILPQAFELCFSLRWACSSTFVLLWALCLLAVLTDLPMTVCPQFQPVKLVGVLYQSAISHRVSLCSTISTFSLFDAKLQRLQGTTATVPHANQERTYAGRYGSSMTKLLKFRILIPKCTIRHHKWWLHGVVVSEAG